MQPWIEFLTFSDPATQIVTLGSVLLGAVASIVGCFTFLQKRALIGDTISHSVLPGICFAFVLSGTKNPYYLLIGAFISGWLSVLIADYITRNSKLKADTSIAIILSSFFALGMMMLSSIQHSGNANQSGLHDFLFGNAAAIIKEDVIMFLWIAAITFVIIGIYFRAFKLYIFDIEFAKSIGLPVKYLDFLLTTLAVLAIALGIRAVGVVMMSALLITPAAAARFWTGSLKKMLFVAAFVGSISGFLGAMISYTRPKMPTGPWIIIVLSLIAFASILLGSEKGVLQKLRKRKQFRNKVLLENVLKIFYHLGEQDHDIFKARSIASLKARRDLKMSNLVKGLNQLKRKKLVTQTQSNWKLTETGSIESKKLIRLHRLWELYLSEHLNIAADHVHDDAEAIEHILTPDLLAQLEVILKGQKIDPHNKSIPTLNDDYS